MRKIQEGSLAWKLGKFPMARAIGNSATFQWRARLGNSKQVPPLNRSEKDVKTDLTDWALPVRIFWGLRQKNPPGAGLISYSP